MSIENELTAAFIEGYKVAGEETGYWGRRFLQAVKRSGGLVTAKRMLLPRNQSQRKGLDAILEAGKPELTVEAIILQDRFRGLFTSEEIKVARERLGQFEIDSVKARGARERLYPEELEPGKPYVEGARKQIRVNAYERDPRARKACLKRHGYNCAVCGFDFESRYGEIGKEFIHVHHLHPLALTDGEYVLDPAEDLRPVCPNCHAMLHRGKSVLSIDELKQKLVPPGANNSLQARRP